MASVHSPVARVPFAPLDNPRLQHLASAKNRQNGLVAPKSTTPQGKSVLANSNIISPAKRSFEPAFAFDDGDSENVDPAIFDSPSKKSKSEASTKPFTFTLTPKKSMPPPTAIPSRLLTPARANISSPRTPRTAPAGRSPTRKIAGLGKSRRVSAPFTRIDPPATSRTTLPFSLDAALSGTFSSSCSAKSDAKNSAATVPACMPKNWFFTIYEDSPEEEAANLMEHSTLTLDLSSDEESSKREKSERGKENTPPEGYDALAASRVHGETPKQVKKTEIIRQKLCTAEMDDGQRSPLSDLETDPFIPDGLEKGSHVLVDAVVEKSAEVAAPTVPALPPSVDGDEAGEAKEDIVVWEDSAAEEIV